MSPVVSFLLFAVLFRWSGAQMRKLVILMSAFLLLCGPVFVNAGDVVSANFKGAPISVLAKNVSAVTKQAISVDPSVAELTLDFVTPEESPDAYFSDFEKALETIGLTMVANADGSYTVREVKPAAPAS